MKTSIIVLLACLLVGCSRENPVEQQPPRSYRIEGTWRAANYGTTITLFSMTTSPTDSVDGLGFVLAGTVTQALFTINGKVDFDSAYLRLTSTFSSDKGRSINFSGKFLTDSILVGQVDNPSIGIAYLKNPIVFSNQ